jgi:glucose/arabinose dehydrogenase
MGWRNPWRFSFDSLNGDMWIADVGQNEFEEINREPSGTPGRNYGWRCFEAAAEYNTSGCQDRSHYTFPVAAYEHGSGLPCGGSVSGGYVYRGQDYPKLNGFYFYADYCSGQIYSLDASQATYTSHPTLETELRITTFGIDNRGELYLADISKGTIYQLVDSR